MTIIHVYITKVMRQLSYTVIFGDGSVSPEKHDGEWEYDHNGDYNAVVKVVNDGK